MTSADELTPLTLMARVVQLPWAIARAGLCWRAADKVARFAIATSPRSSSTRIALAPMALHLVEDLVLVGERLAPEVTGD